jgi:hypothetical protein
MAYQSLTASRPRVYRHFNFPGAEDLGNMFQFKRDFEDVFCGVRDIAFTRSLNPSLLTFDVDVDKGDLAHLVAKFGNPVVFKARCYRLRGGEASRDEAQG